MTTCLVGKPPLARQLLHACESLRGALLADGLPSGVLLADEREGCVRERGGPLP